MLHSSMKSRTTPVTPSFSPPALRHKPHSPVTPLLSHSCASRTSNPFKITFLRKTHRGVPHHSPIPILESFLGVPPATQRLRANFSPAPGILCVRAQHCCAPGA